MRALRDLLIVCGFGGLAREGGTIFFSRMEKMKGGKGERVRAGWFGYFVAGVVE